MYNFKTMIKRLLHYLKPYRVRFIFALITTTIYVGLTLYAPYIIGVEIVALFNESFELSMLTIPVVKLAVVTVAGCVFGAIMGRLLNVISYLIIKDIIDSFSKKKDNKNNENESIKNEVKNEVKIISNFTGDESMHHQ